MADERTLILVKPDAFKCFVQNLKVFNIGGSVGKYDVKIRTFFEKRIILRAVHRKGENIRVADAFVVDVMLNANGKTSTHVLRARVESKGRDGINLVFTSADIDTYSALLHLNLKE